MCSQQQSKAKQHSYYNTNYKLIILTNLSVALVSGLVGLAAVVTTADDIRRGPLRNVRFARASASVVADDSVV